MKCFVNRSRKETSSWRSPRRSVRTRRPQSMTWKRSSSKKRKKSKKSRDNSARPPQAKGNTTRRLTAFKQSYSFWRNKCRMSALKKERLSTSWRRPAKILKPPRNESRTSRRPSTRWSSWARRRIISYWAKSSARTTWFAASRISTVDSSRSSRSWKKSASASRSTWRRMRGPRIRFMNGSPTRKPRSTSSRNSEMKTSTRSSRRSDLSNSERAR